jgi:hypothetical protein
VPGGTGAVVGVGRRGGEDGADKRGPCVSEGKERRRESKKKTSSMKYANGARGPSD